MLSAVALDPGTARYSEVGKRQLGGFEAAALAKEPNRTRVMHDRVELLGHLSDVDVRPSSDVGGGWWSGAGVHESAGDRPSHVRSATQGRQRHLSAWLSQRPQYANVVPRQRRA